MAFRARLCFFTVLLEILTANLQVKAAFGQPQVPCYFIFGDSLVDNGNNNNLPTTAKANYKPYGIDFAKGTSTGRFCNGRNIADFLAELLRFGSPIPPFAAATGPNIIRGVNYGSGGAGIRGETGYVVGDRFSLNQQLLNHLTTISSLTALFVGNPISAKEHLSKCLYTVTIGSNDYLNNYFMPQFYPTSRQYTPKQYADVLSQQYFQQLKTFYNLGARKVAIFGLSRLGCIPQALSTHKPNISGCVDPINDAVVLFNDKLKMIVDDLNTNFRDAKFIYINTHRLSNEAGQVLVSAGVKVFNASCCQVELTGQCTPGGTTCSNRREYAYWDNIHPTEIVNQETMKVAYKAVSPLDAHPFDIKTLVQLDLMKNNKINTEKMNL